MFKKVTQPVFLEHQKQDSFSETSINNVLTVGDLSPATSRDQAGTELVASKYQNYIYLDA